MPPVRLKAVAEIGPEAASNAGAKGLAKGSENNIGYITLYSTTCIRVPYVDDTIGPSGRACTVDRVKLDIIQRIYIALGFESCCPVASECVTFSEKKKKGPDSE